MGKKSFKPKVQSRLLKYSVLRPSVYISMDDPMFSSTFSDLFLEHIEGFIGLRKEKIVYKDKKEMPEWKRRLVEKNEIKSFIIDCRFDATRSKAPEGLPHIPTSRSVSSY